jgi:uncharacterized protein YqjF (DUF2071 family)
MLNYIVEPTLLLPLVPPGTELDYYRGTTFVSLVGFLFLDTKLVGLPIPRHRNFEEVNLRFYVRRRSADTWRRGVCFVREIVPRQAIAIVARTFYGERYMALPMKHDVVQENGMISVEYGWRRGLKWESLSMTGSGEPVTVAAGTHEEFIVDHHWGYTSVARGLSEYHVEHPRWRIWPAMMWELQSNIADLYGSEFVETLTAKPTSAFIAEGSFVSVFRREVTVVP